MKELIPGLYMSNYPEVARMSEKRRAEFVKVALLWPWEVVEGESMELAYQRYRKAPWKGEFSDYDLCFSDPEAIDMDYLDMDALNHVADQIQTNLSLGKKSVIFCKQGLERTPVAAIWFLHKYREMDVYEAERFVRQKHPATAHTIGNWVMQLEKADSKP